MEINVHQAKTQFSKLLQRVALGEEVTIAKAGVPVAKLVPVKVVQGKRPLGFYRDQIWIADDFDAPLPDDILASFYGEDSTDSTVRKPVKRASAKKRKKA